MVLVLAVSTLVAVGRPWAETRESRASGRAATNPFAGRMLWVNPRTSASRDARAVATTDPAQARLLRRIAARPQAIWIGDWTQDVRQAVERDVTAITRAGALPVLAAYNIPFRDCGSHSEGGAPTPRAYERWVRDLAAGIGSRRAAVILEPDGLAALDCLAGPRQVERLALIRKAVQSLEARRGVSVYIDAGHSAWLPARTMVKRLRRAGIAGAQGFALNVSNFRTTRSEVAYGSAISHRTGGKHFVIDTSRNGRRPAPAAQWCNPPGRGLGAPPRTRRLPSRLVDALLWVKPPGESDGTCNGGPPAGRWWRAYALGLARRAHR